MFFPKTQTWLIVYTFCLGQILLAPVCPLVVVEVNDPHNWVEIRQFIFYFSFVQDVISKKSLR